MEKDLLQEKAAPEKPRADEKVAAYVCRSCGAVAPKKKGLCRPEKIKK
jgi:hypothetical protein